MLGYLDNKSATADTLRDGWCHTGDIAVYDKEGRFAIVDRLKELIKVKGFQVNIKNYSLWKQNDKDFFTLRFLRLSLRICCAVSMAWLMWRS